MSAVDTYYEYKLRNLGNLTRGSGWATKGGGMSVKTESTIFLADLDWCFFHFRGVDSRFEDLVPRTYNTFFLVLKCAEKTLKNYPTFIVV